MCVVIRQAVKRGGGGGGGGGGGLQGVTAVRDSAEAKLNSSVSKEAEHLDSREKTETANEKMQVQNGY